MPLVSSSRAHARAGVFASALAAVLAARCYNPVISEKLQCNKTYQAGAGDCPDGYHCGDDGHCHKGPTGAGGGAGGRAGSGGAAGGGAGGHTDGGAGMTAGASGSGGSPVDSGTDMPVACNTPLSGCTADTTGETCDPVCQAGCACHEKCSVNTAGTLTCNEPLALRAKGLGEGCNYASLGTAAQTDDCMPGLVCLQDACASRCYRFCKTDADCPLSTCSRNAGGGVKVCDVQSTTCNPVKNNGMPTGCPAEAQGCFLLPNGTDTTLCDCPGASPPNTLCGNSRDCFPGLVCVDVGGTGSAICRPACGLATSAMDCPGSTCTAIKGSKKYGYCSN
ncbi:MAG TPA: hypothetical protein VHL80_19165 [Polyangia bacterium]|nr:hypothetical protein [Polyangia bacterium]